MYIVIDKEWFEKNKQKFEDNAGEEGKYCISDDVMKVGEVYLPDGVQNYNSIWIQQEEVNENCYVSLNYIPTPEQIVQLVENSIDDIKGESLSKIIELVVKKLNKLRSFLESIKGL